MAKEQIKSKGSSTEKKLRVRPLGDRALVKLTDGAEGDETTASGIILPPNAEKDRSDKRGTVIAVGPGKREDAAVIPMEVRVGDTVIFQWGDKVEIDGDEYYIVNESNIVAVVE
jgi:chaperonin GroES